MKRIVPIIALLVIFCLPAQAAWEDPWNKGKGFDDPFQKDAQEAPAKQPETPSKAPAAPSPAPNKPKSTYGQEIPSLPGQVKPEERRNPLTQPGQQSLPGQQTPSYNNEPDITSQNRSQIYSTAFGIPVGSKMEEAVAQLGLNGLVDMGECNGGQLWVQDPANFCVAVTIGGKQTVTGATTFVSKKCVEANPLLYAVHKGFVMEDSKEFREGWEKTVGTAPKVASCMRQTGALADAWAPSFLGLIHSNSQPEAVDAVMVKMGGKIDRTFANGRKYSLKGCTIWYEFCKFDGKPVEISIDIATKDKDLLRRIKQMNISKDVMNFEGIDIVTAFSKNGSPSKIEYKFRNNKSKCDSNKA